MLINGTSGDDVLDGTSGNDTINGLAGNDMIRPDGGGDSVDGGDGDDVIYFGPGQFVFHTQQSNPAGSDIVMGGAGNDELVLDGNYTLVLNGAQIQNIETVTLSRGQQANPNTFTISTVDWLVSGGRTLTIQGGQLATALNFDGTAEYDIFNGPGNFRVYGGEAGDVLRGGVGDDWFHGGAGADVMTGGGRFGYNLSDDIFAYTSASDSTLAATDTIGDFNAGDRIDLSAVDAIAGTAAVDGFVWSTDANFHNFAGELRYRSTSATTGFLEGDTDGNGSADLSIAITLTNGHVFGQGDVILSNAPPPPKTAFGAPQDWGTDIHDYASTYVGDFNGDGKDDVYYLQLRALYISDGDSFYRNDIFRAQLPVGYRFNIGDFNGDGRADAFRYIPGTGNEMYISVVSDTIYTTDFKAGGIWTNAGKGDADWSVGDFNGDGKDDIFRYLYGASGADMFLSDGTKFVADGSWTPAGFGARGWFVGDFNGDGKDDVFRYLPGESGADMWLSTGSGFAHAGSWTPAEPGDENWYVGDFNGDGKDDIARYLLGQSGADVFLSSGTGFVHDGSWTTAGHGNGFWSVGDFDGDGSSDFLRIVSSGVDVLL